MHNLLPSLLPTNRIGNSNNYQEQLQQHIFPLYIVAKVMDFNLMTNDIGATVYAFTLRMRATGTLEWPLTQF